MERETGVGWGEECTAWVCDPPTRNSRYDDGLCSYIMSIDKQPRGECSLLEQPQHPHQAEQDNNKITTAPKQQQQQQQNSNENNAEGTEAADDKSDVVCDFDAFYAELPVDEVWPDDATDAAAVAPLYPHQLLSALSERIPQTTETSEKDSENDDLASSLFTQPVMRKLNFIDESDNFEKLADFLVIPSRSSSKKICEKLFHDWRLERPKLIISVSGWSSHMPLIPPRQLLRLKQGLLRTVQSTNTWIFSTGITQGYSST